MPLHSIHTFGRALAMNTPITVVPGAGPALPVAVGAGLTNRGMVREKNEAATIRGFSTIKQVELDDDGRPAIGVFSGDTILHHEYWGDRSLKDGFVRYMLKLKLSNPLRRVYWLLISKGYKTYLLMAKNFVEYYPRHDRPNDPKLERLVRAYCDQLFPGKYDASGKVLDFGDTSQKLRGEVAFCAPGGLANDGKVIEDRRIY